MEKLKVLYSDDKITYVNIFYKLKTYFKILLFFNIYFLFLAVLSLCCCAWAFSSCDVWVSHHGGFSSCGAWALGVQASVVVACGLSSCGTQGQLP